MRAYAKSIASMIGVGLVAALCAPVVPATAAAPTAGNPSAGRWTKPDIVAKGEITEVLAPPGYGNNYGENNFVWQQGSTLKSSLLRRGTDRVASGVTASAASRTALAWHQGQGRGEGVHLSVYRTLGDVGGEPGWAESPPMLVPDSYDPAATPSLAVADDLPAMTSAVVYSRTTPEGVQLEATAYSTGGSSTTQVTLGASQVLAMPGGHLDELAAVHGAKFIAVAYRRTAADGATSVVLRTSPVTDTVNELTWGPEQIVCQAPAGAAVACSQPTFGRDKKKNVHLFLRGPEGVQHRTVSASGAAEPVVLGPATGPLAVMDASWAYDSGRGKSYDVDLSVAATHGNRTTVWRLPAAGPAVGTSVRTPGVRVLALGQHGTGRMLVWSDGTGVTTWSDERPTAVTRVASDVSRVTEVGVSGGYAPRIWYVAGAGRGERLATTLLDQQAPVVSGWRSWVTTHRSGPMRLFYRFIVADEGGLARSVVQVRSGTTARHPGRWRTLKIVAHRGRFDAWHWSSFRVTQGVCHDLRIRSIDSVGHRSAWKRARSRGKATCVK